MILGKPIRLHRGGASNSVLSLRTIVSRLKARNASLPDELLYDDEGSRIFDMLVNNPEYYLARQENDILIRNRQRIAGYRPWGSVIELGSGSSQKTRSLLDAIALTRPVSFYPIDINENIMGVGLTTKDEDLFRGVEVRPVVGVYEQGLRFARKLRKPKLFLFLGSSTSQLTSEKIYRNISSSMSAEDLALIAFDLTQDSDKILRTYSLPEVRAHSANGISALNRLLAKPLDIKRMEFVNVWDGVRSRSETHQYLRCTQTVLFPRSSLGVTASPIELQAGSSIRTAIQRKYKEADVGGIIARARLMVHETLFNDDKSYGIFVVSAVPGAASKGAI